MTLRIHGDNIIECERTLLLIAKAFEVQAKSNSNCLYLPSYLLKTPKETIKIELFAGHERWGININKELSKYGAPLREAADSYITQLQENLREELLFAVEYCNALPAGNNAWQRNGRAITCAETGVPYLYFAEVGGVELDSSRKVKAPRFPNPIVPFSYLTAAKTLNVICIPIYEAHPAITDNLRGKFEPVFGMEISLQLIKYLIEKGNQNNSLDILEEKGLTLVQILSDERKTVDTFRGNEWQVFYKLKSSIDKVNWIKNFKGKQIWKKKTSSKVMITETMKQLLEKTVAINCLSIGAKDIPICLIANGNIKRFSELLNSIYKNDSISDIADTIYKKNAPLLLVWLTGFKPRGDDSRPDRGLVPLARMLFGNDIDILSIVYGPAKSLTWKKFNENYHDLAEENGLWQAVINLSNYILIDSVTSEYGPIGKKDELNTKSKQKKVIMDAANYDVIFTEHDVDTAIHSLFTKNKPNNIFESMCNPPGGDWSGISIYQNDENTEYRWTSLPRVSEIKAKRPDHVFQIFMNDMIAFLSIESKNKAMNLESEIGKRLKSYIDLLFKNRPTAIRKNNHQWSLYEKNNFAINNFKVFSGGAFCHENNQQITDKMKSGGLDFIMAFQFQKPPNQTVLHICCNKQCQFLIEVIRNLSSNFGNGLEIKVY